jgi:hypothetical protein
MDKIKNQELDSYWGGDIHTDDIELKAIISKLDSLIAKGTYTK